ncbi:SRPBCC family protein [Paenibacillus sp. E222]|nr:SRPBCC family protein [Paenibacillus sp. E222]
MLKAMVVRAGSGWGKALVKQLIGANVEVVAYSGSQRKLEALKEAFSSSSLLRTARGEAGNRSKLLAAAEGVDVIFCGVYLTYDDNPEKVRRMLEAVRSVAAATGAKTVTLEGVYLPADEEEPMNPNLPGATSMRIFSPELYGDAVSNTLIHYALRKIVQEKPVKLLIDPSVRRDYLYVDDAARYVLELASMESAYGGDWHLRGTGQISQAELFDFTSPVVQAAPRFEPIGGWQRRLLQLYEPKVKGMLDRYEKRWDALGTYGKGYGGVSISYQEGIASTVKRMLAKYKVQSFNSKSSEMRSLKMKKSKEAVGVTGSENTEGMSVRGGAIDVDRNAQVIVDLSIEIEASQETVWGIQTGIEQWPTWQKDIAQVRLSGPIAIGSTFRWETHGLQIVSTILEVDPMNRIVWGGPAHGIEGVHVWSITPTPKGVLVHTTESWDGPPVAADPDGMSAALEASLSAWLAALKTAAESLQLTSGDK